MPSYPLGSLIGWQGSPRPPRAGRHLKDDSTWPHLGPDTAPLPAPCSRRKHARLPPGHAGPGTSAHRADFPPPGHRTGLSSAAVLQRPRGHSCPSEPLLLRDKQSDPLTCLPGCPHNSLQQANFLAEVVQVPLRLGHLWVKCQLGGTDPQRACRAPPQSTLASGQPRGAPGTSVLSSSLLERCTRLSPALR